MNYTNLQELISELKEMKVSYTTRTVGRFTTIDTEDFTVDAFKGGRIINIFIK